MICRRGLTPPHRVKSVTMASFTPEEIEFLKNRGNEVNIQSYNSHSHCGYDLLIILFPPKTLAVL